VEAGWTLGTAESCTGGLLAGTITAVAGSSRYFAGGIVSYSDELKRRLLEVPAELLTRHGAVSAEVAIAMAQAARERLGVDLAIAVTGIAGPGSDGSDKRVGLTFIAVADAESARVNRYEWKGDRSENRRLSVEAALQMALAAVVREAGAKEA
jgi:PncC family amidohydrolase